MTYSQVMLFGQTSPISTQTENQLKEVRRNPMLDWGRANEVIGAEPKGEYSAIDYNLSVTAMLKQQKELEWASGVLKSKPATREELALTELERVFGKHIDFKSNDDTSIEGRAKAIEARLAVITALSKELAGKIKP